MYICEAAHREIHYKYIFLILKIPEIAQIEKSFNYFSHKVTWINKTNKIVAKSHKSRRRIKIEIGNFHCVV